RAHQVRGDLVGTASLDLVTMHEHHHLAVLEQCRRRTRRLVLAEVTARPRGGGHVLYREHGVDLVRLGAGLCYSLAQPGPRFASCTTAHAVDEYQRGAVQGTQRGVHILDALQFLHADPGEILAHRLDHHFGVGHFHSLLVIHPWK